jgi:hypothetical protein
MAVLLFQNYVNHLNRLWLHVMFAKHILKQISINFFNLIFLLNYITNHQSEPLKTSEIKYSKQIRNRIARKLKSQKVTAVFVVRLKLIVTETKEFSQKSKKFQLKKI